MVDYRTYICLTWPGALEYWIIFPLIVDSFEVFPERCNDEGRRKIKLLKNKGPG